MRYIPAVLALISLGGSANADMLKSASAPGWWPGVGGLYVCEQADLNAVHEFFRSGELNRRSCSLADDSGGDGTPLVPDILTVRISPAGLYAYDKNEASILVESYSLKDCTGAEQIATDVLKKLGIGAGAIMDVGCTSREGRMDIDVSRTANAGDFIGTQKSPEPAPGPPPPRRTTFVKAPMAVSGNNPAPECNRNKATGKCLGAMAR